ncbi:hypothetical protein SOVF_124990 [Spinacia oleracea]|uniref:Uncharacterized protein isoform X2 n=1 Tax=Spinacia oleracea TaxID=3562 RepID=A0A9R0JKR6_SPIOL|nr:uncharacterized protein LOC110777615 isoform X2 [Spinacia oleracea]KNA12512.1 hypothetical protein SOVF_124990 [Spinacia oleracea]
MWRNFPSPGGVLPFPCQECKIEFQAIFDALLNKGSSNNSSKSSFLQRASSYPVPSSHRQGSNTGKSFTFGRDGSNSRSSMSSLEDSLNLIGNEVREIFSTWENEVVQVFFELVGRNIEGSKWSFAFIYGAYLDCQFSSYDKEHIDEVRTQWVRHIVQQQVMSESILTK